MPASDIACMMHALAGVTLRVRVRVRPRANEVSKWQRYYCVVKVRVRVEEML